MEKGNRKTEKGKTLHAEVICDRDKFTTIIYSKPTFSGINCNFENLLLSVCKCGIVYSLVYRCFRICSVWIQFDRE